MTSALRPIILSLIAQELSPYLYKWVLGGYIHLCATRASKFGFGIENDVHHILKIGQFLNIPSSRNLLNCPF